MYWNTESQASMGDCLLPFCPIREYFTQKGRRHCRWKNWKKIGLNIYCLDASIVTSFEITEQWKEAQGLSPFWIRGLWRPEMRTVPNYLKINKKFIPVKCKIRKRQVVFYLGHSLTPFFIYAIIQFGPKTGLAPDI